MGDVLDQPAGEPVLKLFSVNVLPEAQRKGIGTRLVQIAEMAAKQANMCFVHAQVTSENDSAHNFFSQKLKGYRPDEVAEYCEVELEDEEELATFTLYSKSLKKAIRKVEPEEEQQDAKLIESIVHKIAQLEPGAAPEDQAEAIL